MEANDIFTISLKKTVTKFGKKILLRKNKTKLINILNDYRAFSLDPMLKQILMSFVDVGIVEDAVYLSKDDDRHNILELKINHYMRIGKFPAELCFVVVNALLDVCKWKNTVVDYSLSNYKILLSYNKIYETPSFIRKNFEIVRVISESSFAIVAYIFTLCAIFYGCFEQWVICTLDVLVILVAICTYFFIVSPYFQHRISNNARRIGQIAGWYDKLDKFVKGVLEHISL